MVQRISSARITGGWIMKRIVEEREQYDLYRDGKWWIPTGYEVFDGGIWWDEYEDYDGNISLFN